MQRHGNGKNQSEMTHSKKKRWSRGCLSCKFQLRNSHTAVVGTISPAQSAFEERTFLKAWTLTWNAPPTSSSRISSREYCWTNTNPSKAVAVAKTLDVLLFCEKTNWPYRKWSCLRCTVGILWRCPNIIIQSFGTRTSPWMLWTRFRHRYWFESSMIHLDSFLRTHWQLFAFVNRWSRPPRFREKVTPTIDISISIQATVTFVSSIFISSTCHL